MAGRISIPGRALATALLLALFVTGAAAASFLSEQQARAKAIVVLKGDPYGKTTAAVLQHIKQAVLVRDGKTRACGAQNRAAWEFHIVVVTADKDAFQNGTIDGYLALDARNGKLLCANLPLLD
jgi:hypothetical protein